ncbi:YdcF family protein [Basilea psittacipulmonis]|uniref:DUF218 domain-containing protein n=1 Tax=Basilea psittacipulmonis DSM 24701 TaxID=1072685 RepID=A0A077DI27_9BURK|nr:YdcF family protein [Basilea psittacipulmonis]AIL32778.1 hypothetical protein IX83_05150 [Basilea psittacipulmonis DSM 24701]
MSSLLVFLIPPVNLAVILLGLACLCLLCKRKKIGIGLGLFGALWALIWSLPYTSIMTGAYLENLYPHKDIQDITAAQAIVVLGGNTAANRVNWFDDLPEETFSRVQRAAEIYHAGKAPIIIVSGGTTSGVVSEAQVMAQRLKSLGVPSSAIIKEEKSTTTYENAKYTASILKEQHIHHIILVTSALHMPRSYHVFSKYPIQIEIASNPNQIDISYNVPVSFYFLPNERALYASRTIIKEYIAWFVYRFRNWI